MSKREFVTATPMRQTIRNSRDEDEMNQAVELLAEKLAPMVAKLLEGEAPATNAGSNGRKLNPSDITSRHFQGLPKGDHWDDVDLNEPIGEEPPRYTPTDGYELPD